MVWHGMAWGNGNPEDGTWSRPVIARTEKCCMRAVHSTVAGLVGWFMYANGDFGRYPYSSRYVVKGN